MNKGLWALPVVAFLFSVLISTGIQASEYTDGSIKYTTSLFAVPRSSRVVCSDIFPQECAFLTFNNGLIKETQLVHTYNNFSTVTTYSISSSDISGSVDYYGEHYPLPFDISYINGAFWLFVKNKVYNFTATSGIQTVRTESVGNSYINFLTSTTAARLEIPSFSGEHNLTERYIVNGSLAADIPESFYSAGYQGTGLQKIQGFFAKSGSTYIYDVYYQFDRQGAGLTTKQFTDIGTFASDYDGLFYYDGSNLVFHRAENVSANVSRGVYESATTDLSTFQSPSLLYEENTSINESIRMADFKQGEGYGVYAFERYSNSSATGQASGIYTYYQPEYRIIIQPKFWNINTLSQESGTIAVNLTCGNTSRSYTGTSVTASSPCTNPTITIISDYAPTTYTFTYNIPSGCESSINYIFPLYWKSYTVNIYAIDDIYGTPISGAFLTIGTATNTTNADGYANFTLYPLVNVSFAKTENNPQCYWNLVANGNPKIFQVLSSKSGYNSELSTLQLVDSSPTSPSEFDIAKSIRMTPVSASVQVHLYTQDIVEISPATAVIRENGTQKTYIYTSGDYLQTDVIQDSLPVTFILVDNRSSWTTNISVEYFGKTYYKTLTVESQKNYRVDLFINEISTNMSCSSPNDCRASFCKGTYYKDFSGCVNNVCTYENEQCLSSILCDDKVGCFNSKTTTTCTNDKNCNTTCLNNYTMIVGKCLSDGYCGNINRICTENCNQTLGVCNELSSCISGKEETFEESLYQNGIKVLGASTTITCDFNNIGKSFCVPKTHVKKSDLTHFGASIGSLLVSPAGLPYTELSDEYQFYALSVSCNDTCGISYEVCYQDCEFSTGKCVGKGVPLSQFGKQTNEILEGFIILLNAIFPNMQSKTIASSILVIIIMVAIGYGLNKVNATNNWEIAVSVGVVLALALAFVGWIDVLLTIIFAIIAGFLVARSLFWGNGG